MSWRGHAKYSNYCYHWKLQRSVAPAGCAVRSDLPGALGRTEVMAVLRGPTALWRGRRAGTGAMTAAAPR